MWANKEGEREVGKGLAHFICWMVIQASIIVILEGLHLLPGDLLGIPIDYNSVTKFPETFTYYCGIIGGIYTAIGCMIILKYEVNTKEWWLHFCGWYLLYCLYPIWHSSTISAGGLWMYGAHPFCGLERLN